MNRGGDPEVVLHRDRDIAVSLRPSLIHAGRRLRIGERLTIGSAPDSDLRMDPSLAAAHHAVVRTGADGAPTIGELSGIGLLVNDEVVRGGERRLHGGDRVVIGGEAFFVTDGTEATLPSMGQRPGERSVLTIGSDPGCDIVLSHPAVSPIHAAIEHKGGGAFVRDHTPHGELTVDGRPVRVEPLAPGSELAVGPFRLVFDGTTVITRDAGTIRLVAADAAKWAGGKQILQPTTLSLATAELVAVIGTSGAGKSTLLRLLAAGDEPDTGVITLGGEPIAARRTDIGYVPQDEIAHRELTVTEALRYAALLRLPQDSGPERIDRAVAEIMAELGLDAHGDTRVGHLSGGQRRRVGLATELVHQPAVLLLDEPTTGLDPGLERRTMRLLRKLANESRAVLLVTHATRSLELCDKLLILAPGGFTCFFGTPQEALAHFGVDELDEIYDALEEGGGERLAASFHETAEFQRQHDDVRLGTMGADHSRPAARGASLSLPRETATLLSRYLRVFTRDRRSLILLLAQAPLLGILAALIFSSGALSAGDQAKDATNLIFILTTIAVWAGTIAASREIVRERPLLMRELALGVRLRSYLGSKMIVLGALAVIQVATMAACVLAIRQPAASGGEVLGLVACLLLAGVVAVTLGLAISAYADTENQANSLIPLALIPQLLLGGAIFAVATMSAPMQGLAAFVFARWAFAGAGTAYDLPRRMDADPVFGKVHEYGYSFFDLNVPELTLIACLFISVSLGAAAYFVKRDEVGFR